MTKPSLSSQRVSTLGQVERQIYVIRGQKVMLDSDLAELYEVSVRELNQAIKRNEGRFPEDFVFQLAEKEMESLRSQSVISKAESLRSQIVTSKRGGRRYLPYVFTEHGVAMLSAVLHSPRAVKMSIMVVRAFVRLREMIAQDKDMALRIEKLEANHHKIGSVIDVLVDEIDSIAREIRDIKTKPVPAKRKIGFDL
jgi:hypothetical protein